MLYIFLGNSRLNLQVGGKWKTTKATHYGNTVDGTVAKPY